jgi:hypothetical protein
MKYRWWKPETVNYRLKNLKDLNVIQLICIEPRTHWNPFFDELLNLCIDGTWRIDFDERDVVGRMPLIELTRQISFQRRDFSIFVRLIESDLVRPSLNLSIADANGDTPLHVMFGMDPPRDLYHRKAVSQLTQSIIDRPVLLRTIDLYAPNSVGATIFACFSSMCESLARSPWAHLDGCRFRSMPGELEAAWWQIARSVYTRELDRHIIPDLAHVVLEYVCGSVAITKTKKKHASG